MRLASSVAYAAIAPTNSPHEIGGTTSLAGGPTSGTPSSRIRYQFWSHRTGASLRMWNGSPGLIAAIESVLVRNEARVTRPT